MTISGRYAYTQNLKKFHALHPLLRPGRALLFDAFDQKIKVCGHPKERERKERQLVSLARARMENQ